MTSALEPNNIDLTTIPGRVLNISSRMCLSRLLNPKQPLLSSNGCARDYRGLAELMDFEYIDILNFQRHEDPTFKIIEAWEGRPTATLGGLLDMLVQMERHDVVDDALPLFRTDAAAYLRRKMVQSEAPIQVTEVSSCRASELRNESSNALTINDLLCETGNAVYDAYVCYTQEDSLFVERFVNYLESPQIGIKLFIKGRDLLLGVDETDAYVKLIEERCLRMIIILSPAFLRSSECEFQTNFATGLSIEQRKRKLIPIFYKDCECPRILRFVSKINFSKEGGDKWLWSRLFLSLRGSPNMFMLSAAIEARASSTREDMSLQSTSQTSEIIFPSLADFPELTYPNRSQYPEITYPNASQYPEITYPNASQYPELTYPNASQYPVLNISDTLPMPRSTFSSSSSLSDLNFSTASLHSQSNFPSTSSLSDFSLSSITSQTGFNFNPAPLQQEQLIQGTTTEPIITFPPTSNYQYIPEEISPPIYNDVTSDISRDLNAPAKNTTTLESRKQPSKGKRIRNFFKGMKLGSSKASSPTSDSLSTASTSTLTSGYCSVNDGMIDSDEACEAQAFT